MPNPELSVVEMGMRMVRIPNPQTGELKEFSIREYTGRFYRYYYQTLTDYGRDETWRESVPINSVEAELEVQEPDGSWKFRKILVGIASTIFDPSHPSLKVGKVMGIILL